jgi:PadR family transcriptional regulator, regulatory protein PadR
MPGSDLFTGTLDLLVLRALRGGPLHGYAIGRWIRETSAALLEIEEGALYPALHRLERRGLIDADWGQTELNRQAKFYRLTAAGRRVLKAETTRWHDYVRGVMLVLDAEQTR